MTLSELKERMRHFQKSAEIIFDDEEPIGAAMDLVMPRKRWFRRQFNTPAKRTPVPQNQTQS